MRTLLVFGALLSGCSTPAWAEPPPRSLDQALVDTLALGSAPGCGLAFGIPVVEGDFNQPDAFLLGERIARRLGDELSAICGRSAVSSAASLGGSFGSLQTTKTVSQFRMARNRADSRLDASGKRADLERPILLAQLGGSASPLSAGPAMGARADAGPGVFVHLDTERRSREATALEAGYSANVSEAMVGVDYATRGQWAAGVWLGYRGVDARYRGAQPLIRGVGATFGASLDAALQADMCKLGAGGGFDDRGARVGAFVARRVDGAFVDLGIQYSRRDYEYQRHVCAIESSSDAIVKDPSTNPRNISGFSSGGVFIDDIYAGIVSGKSSLTEWALSARAGLDLGGERFQWGPRLSLTVLRTTVGAFTETGRTSVTHTVTSASGALVTPRKTGDPTGLELAFDPQRRTSVQSEAQLVAAYRHEAGFGTLVPRVSVSWLHEFKGERVGVDVRLAQDFRPSPTRFSFTTDAVDKNKGSVALGLALVAGPQFSADIEVSRLVADDRFDATRTSLQALWRF